MGIYKRISKKQVIEEYNQSALSPSDHEKAKWGSLQSMINRFLLAKRLINFEIVSRWLDIGCGPGSFFSLIDSEHKFDVLVGLDISMKMIECAIKKPMQSKTYFLVGDLEFLPFKNSSLDLLTMIGVLQQCGISPEIAIKKAARVLAEGGRLFLTTKNLGWNKFKEEGFNPYPGHSWFFYDEIATILQSNGIEIREHGGFLPREGRLVEINESHTFYILGERS